MLRLRSFGVTRVSARGGGRVRMCDPFEHPVMRLFHFLTGSSGGWN